MVVHDLYLIYAFYDLLYIYLYIYKLRVKSKYQIPHRTSAETKCSQKVACE